MEKSEDKMEGYTHEEFCALLDLMQVKYVTRDPLARSPKERMRIINYFRSQKREKHKVQEFLNEI
jgi:DNA-directed RNA polymerase specialized sigma24 family protein